MSENSVQPSDVWTFCPNEIWTPPSPDMGYFGSQENEQIEITTETSSYGEVSSSQQAIEEWLDNFLK